LTQLYNLSHYTGGKHHLDSTIINACML